MTSVETETTLSPAQLAGILADVGTLDLIDVCSPAEFEGVHLACARYIPLDCLDPADLLRSRRGAPGEPLYVICRTGARGRQARARLLQAGVPRVLNVEGGTQACVDAGLAVVRGRKTIGLERQVRIAAGSLVLVGVALGWFVHPGFLALAAFVGAGLVFAGVTDYCGMALLLARMPWNR